MKTARHLGYCPACDGTFKVRGEKLVHHGYKRPGYGYIEGDCLGALETPHELSPELAKRCLEGAKAWQARTERFLAHLETATELRRERTRSAGFGQRETYVETLVQGECPDYEFRLERERQQWRAQSELRAATSEVTRLGALVETWELKPLTTVMEEQAQKAEAKKEREAKRAKAKADKVQAKVESYQKRIDAALRTKNGRTLADIWESAQRKLREIDSDLSREDTLRMLDRDHVWAAFGLAGLVLSHWKTPVSERPEDAPLRALNGANKKSWPEELS